MWHVNMCIIFGNLLVSLSFNIILGLHVENYEMFNERAVNEEISKSSSHDLVRRETQDKERTDRPGAETEPRPPFENTDTPTVITLGTQSSSKQTVERLGSTRRPEVTTMSNNVPTRNYTVNDNHQYYKSKYDSSGANRWWYPLNEGNNTAVLLQRISKNKQYSATIRTSFPFPYYGHIIDYVTITNKGYVFLGDVVHRFNASSQYVAPLMADFTTNDDTMIAYVDTGNRFTVEWANLSFQDRKVGRFSFQCTILKNGTLIFAYRSVPVPVVELKSDLFQHRVGISDSLRYRVLRHGLFIIDGRLYTTIAHNYYFKYHSVDLPMENVKSGSAFVIIPLPNCVMLKSCTACVSTPTAFSCVWCPRLQRCSDGVDRYRQQWILYGCQTNNQTKCPAAPSTTSATTKSMDKTTNQTRPSTAKVPEVQAEGNETTGSQGKQYSTESTSPTTATTKENKTTPTEEFHKRIHTNKTNNVTVVVTQMPFTTPRTKNDSNEAKDNRGPLNIQGNPGGRSGSSGSDVSNVGAGLIVLSVVIILVALCWFVYAYRHPQSRSGRFLIEHRNPKKWFKNSDGNSSGRMHYTTKSMELTES